MDIWNGHSDRSKIVCLFIMANGNGIVKLNMEIVFGLTFLPITCFFIWLVIWLYCIISKEITDEKDLWWRGLKCVNSNSTNNLHCKEIKLLDFLCLCCKTLLL